MTARNDLYGLSPLFIQNATGAPASTARRWKSKPDTMPEAAQRLTRFADQGDVAEVFGADWSGFKFSAGKLYPPYFRDGFTPFQIAAMFYEQQELWHLRREVKRMMQEQDSEKAKAWAMAKVRRLVTMPNLNQWRE